ncbi:LacI family DNA-binding transcriptional regulator [Sphingomonas elodea]|uniref:LacI family DNA-binding transcriptional regulator n=1 Tax=Sphingomonas elodea TaxID=179878 RepID=UPI00026321D6|nr:LacI family DNA-binding transcriptional regulator [Sphingomonas elodea]
MAVRLKDIARDLGVSTVTVSKVLRGQTDIGEKTRERVLKRMRELNYQPNMLARALAGGRSQAVGLVVPDLVHPFFGEFARSLAGALRSEGLVLVLASSEEDPDIEEQEIKTLLARGVDVLLVASCRPATQPPAALAETTTPVLLIDRQFADLPMDFVGTNDLMVGELAARHLAGIGRRRIAHIGGRGISPTADRLRGFQRALTAAGIDLPDAYVVTRDGFDESGDATGYHAMQELLSLPEPPDAVFCYNDLSAIGAMDAAMQAGLRIPEDIAFIGCGNLRYAEYLRVPLTSVDQSSQRLGDMAAKRVLDLSSGSGGAPQTLRLEPRLIVRKSTVA